MIVRGGEPCSQARCLSVYLYSFCRSDEQLENAINRCTNGIRPHSTLEAIVLFGETLLLRTAMPSTDAPMTNYFSLHDCFQLVSA
jgi:hypothetical protein